MKATHQQSLEGRTVLISGASRGIGEAIATRAARQGANVALFAKTSEPHPKLPGTVYTAAEAVERAGGQALPLVGDIRDDEAVAEAIERTVDRFGGLDVVVNNASAIDVSRTDDLSMKKYDLMQDVNARGAFLLTKTAIPHLRKSVNPHVLTLSPPINLDPKWFATIGTAYTMSKFAMSLVTVGLAAELKADGIAVNSLWPRTTIDTSAVRNVLGESLISRSRTPDIMADAAISILTRPAETATGRCFVDDDVLRDAGVTDFSDYRTSSSDEELELDFWMQWK